MGVSVCLDDLTDVLRMKPMYLWWSVICGQCRWNEDGMGLYQPSTQTVKDAKENSIRVSTHSLSQTPGSSTYKTFLPFSDGPRSCVGQVGAKH